MSTRHRRAAWVGVFAVALALRLLGLGWGLPGRSAPGDPPFHPDEHVVYEQGAALYTAPGAMTFVWGGALYPRLGFAVRSAVERALAPERAFAATLLVLRALNAGVALASLALVAWTASRLLGPGPALAAAALFACLPGPVLDSHYARPDVWMVGFATAALACACQVARSGNRRLLLLGAGLAGLGTATLLSGAIAFPTLLAGWLERREPGARRGGRPARAAGGLVAIAAGGLAGYTLGSFESLLFPDAFRAGLARAAETHAGGGFVAPVALLTRVPLYAFGTPVALAGAAGVAVLWRRHTPGSRTLVVHLLTGVALLTRVGGDMMRHLHSLAPGVAIAAAAAVWAGAGVGARGRPRLAGAAAALLALTSLQLSAAYVLPLQLGEDARQRAGRWLAEHVPAGSAIGFTVLFLGDRSYQPRLPPGHRLRPRALLLRQGFDASGYADLALDWFVTSDHAFGHAATPSARAFLRELAAGERFRRVAAFGPRGRPLCIPDVFGAVRPADLLYVRDRFVVFERRR